MLNSQNHFLCCKFVPLYLFLYFAYKGHHMLLSFPIWLILLSLWSSKVDPCDNYWHNFSGHFSWLSNCPLYVCTHLLQPLIHRVTSYRFCVLALGSSAVVNDGVPVSFSLMVFSGYRPRCGYVGPWAELFWSFSFWPEETVISRGCFQCPFTLTVLGGLLSAWLSPLFIVCRCEDDHSDRWELIPCL